MTTGKRQKLQTTNAYHCAFYKFLPPPSIELLPTAANCCTCCFVL